MIHTYAQNGYYIVLDIYSGAVHSVDKMVYDMLQSLTPPLQETCPSFNLPYNKEDMEEAYAELLELQKNGTLFSTDSYKTLLPETMPLPPVKALCLHVSHDCNLRCKYCFAETGDFGGSRGIMTPETAKKAIDFVIKASAGRRNIEIDFFGGEPLLAEQTVKETVTYANAEGQKHDKNFRFTMTTNGVLLDDNWISYINETMSNVVLSLDGRKEVNDDLRPNAAGKGSYDTIVPKYQELVAKRGDGEYYIRGTFTAKHLDFTEDIKHIASLGFKQISMEPVVLAPESPYALQEAHLDTLFAQYDKLAAEMLEQDTNYNFFHFMVDLQQGPCVIKRLRGCGAGCEYVAITPTGELYPCHQFVGKDEFLLGTLDDGIKKPELMKTFAESGLYKREGCKNCWAKFYCSGGCLASNLNTNGSVEIPYEIGCKLEKKRLECAIMLAVAGRTSGKASPTVR